MPGDYTRRTFNPRENHSGVLMQQGRVMLDADWNEEVELRDRRDRAETLDTLGPCAVSPETPDAFLIEAAGGGVTIAPGRMYVDGLLAENHGEEPLVFEPRIAELKGTAPTPFDEQPYLPGVDPFPGGGPHLVYLDVWQRELTYLEEDDLMEKAVAVDTATRFQTVWQVRVHTEEEAGELDCETPDGELPEWSDLILPAGGRLTSAAVGAPEDTDPCIVSPTGGFRGTENRLYRVEVHRPGNLAEDDEGATFKWSRDNASVATRVTAINPAGDQLTVTRTARDAVLRFSVDDWVEITDDRRELHGLPGEMRRVGGVDDVAGTITLAGAPLPGDFDLVSPTTLHTRVRRWDQRGAVLDAGGGVVANVEDEDGVIPIGAGGGTMVLEDGVEVTFTLDPAGGEFRTGDYWLIAARTVDASVEELVEAPPVGIHHHYCRLAVVTTDDEGELEIEDCRPSEEPPHCECCCTVSVGDGDLSEGDFDDLVTAFEETVAAIGTDTPIEICLLPGNHQLSQTLVIDREQVTITGCGRLSSLAPPAQGPAFDVQAERVVLRRLSIEAETAAALVQVTFSRDFVLAESELSNVVGLAVDVQAGSDLRLVDNRFGVGAEGAVAIRGTGFRIARNLLELAPGTVTQGDRGAIHLRPGTLRATITDNLLRDCPTHGITLGGMIGLFPPLPGLPFFGPVRQVVIDRNQIISCGGTGIASRTILADPPADLQEAPAPVEDLRISGNLIRDCAGLSRLLGPREDGAPYGGIVVGHVSHLRIDGNEITDNGAQQAGAAAAAPAPTAGIFVRDSRGLVIADNVITGNGLGRAGEDIDGDQGGIVGLDLTVNVESDPGTDRPLLRTDGWPAAAVHGNVVEAPRRHALRLEGAGAMQIHDNSLTAYDRFEDDTVGAVLIVNSGLANLLGTAVLLQGGFAAGPPDSGDVRDFLEGDEFLAGGEVSFTSNRVRYRKEGPLQFAAVGIGSFDEVLYTDNQVECAMSFDNPASSLLFPSFLWGMRVMAANNSLTETLNRAILSLYGLGFVQATATSNQATHCILVERLMGSKVMANNLELCCAFPQLRLFELTEPGPFPCPTFPPPAPPGGPNDLGIPPVDPDLTIDPDFTINRPPAVP